MNPITIGIVTEIFIIGGTIVMLAFWSGVLIINTIEYLRETAKP